MSGFSTFLPVSELTCLHACRPKNVHTVHLDTLANRYRLTSCCRLFKKKKGFFCSEIKTHGKGIFKRGMVFSRGREKERKNLSGVSGVSWCSLAFLKNKENANHQFTTTPCLKLIEKESRSLKRNFCQLTAQWSTGAETSHSFWAFPLLELTAEQSVHYQPWSIAKAQSKRAKLQTCLTRTGNM